MTKRRHMTPNSGTSGRSRTATKPLPKKPLRTFNPAAALGILWIVATPRSPERTWPYEVIEFGHEFAWVGRELAHIGILQQLRVRRNGHWEDGYKLAPLQEALDQTHSKTVRCITDYMLKHRGKPYIATLRERGVLSKLLGGIRHRDLGRRLEYAAKFL